MASSRDATAGGPIRRRPVPGTVVDDISDYNMDIYDMYMDSHFEPSPLSSPSSPSSPSFLAVPSLPPRPRPSRSATNLNNAAHHPEIRSDALTTRSINSKSSLPVGFITDQIPPSRAPSLAPERDQAIRRVKSSSAISTVSAFEVVSPSSFPLPAAAAAAAAESTKEPPSKWKSALGSAQYFAGGLISHPSESTRHFSIIRHSHALIWYRGPSTSISITILTDEDVPASRTLWMQQKGFSGNMGMTLKALTGTTSSWIDVTPERQASVENISEADERSIQRDLKRFVKKASGRQKRHTPCETHVVRIPASTVDGYFRLVLCAGPEPGKKILCGSPVFRVASTSTDISVVRGSSLSTMPLEVGVKVASTIGQTMAKKYTGVAGAVVNSKANRVVTNTTVRKVGKMAYQGYHTSGLGDAVNDSWKRQINHTGRYDPLILDAPVVIIGSDAGPEAPFPVKLDGKVVRKTGRSTSELGIPTANLSGVSDTIKLRMGGVFAAWARIQFPKDSGQDDLSLDWYESIVTIAPLRYGPPSVAMKNSVAVHIIHDFEDITLADAKIKVLLMGYLHPAAGISAGPDFIMEEHTQDVLTTLASLGREAWQPHDTVAKLKAVKGERSFGGRLDDATGKVVQQVDRIPLHWAGVRSESSAMQDKVYGNGGLWIPR